MNEEMDPLTRRRLEIEAMEQQAKLNGRINDFIDRNNTELQLGEAYARFSFWHAIGKSPLGQIFLALAIIGGIVIFHGVSGSIFVIGLLIFLVLLLVWRDAAVTLFWLGAIILTIYGLVHVFA